MLKEQRYIILLLQEEQETYSNHINVKKQNIWYFPEITASVKDIQKFKIKNIENLKEVKTSVFEYYKDKYISNKNISKPIRNIETKMDIEIWKSGINETFGNAKYYKNLSTKQKKIKLITMDSLAKMIKYGKVRCNKASNYHKPNSLAEYYYLMHPILIDGIKYVVNMDIRKVPNTIGRFYIHSIQTKEAKIPGN